MHKIEKSNSYECFDKVILTKNEVENKLFSFRNERKELSSWLDLGSKCFFLDSNATRIAGYAWVHFSNFRIVSNSNVHFGDSSAWLGPDYIFPTSRGYGLHTDLIIKRINYLSSMGLEYAVTAINSNNEPSLYNYKKLGFNPVYEISSRRFIFFVFNNIRLIDSSIAKKASLYVCEK